MGGEVEIHATAIVAHDAALGRGVVIGPYAVIESGVAIGDESRIDAHAVIRSGTSMGARNVVHPFAVIGGDPQDKRFAGESTRIAIGDGNVFREHVTAHRGTSHGGGVTRVGSECLFMAGAHVAHDCLVRDGVTLANGTLLGGHVEVGDHVVAGGLVAIAPFVRVGRRVFLAGGAMVERDLPPFVMAAGDRARVRALNRVGLTRAGVSDASMAALERAFRAIFRSGTPRNIAAMALADDPDPLVRELSAFIGR